jgi:hypothetical protein
VLAALLAFKQARPLAPTKLSWDAELFVPRPFLSHVSRK